ncbi:hypothetical protein PFICI_01382 [Pestalotiopsis fici W106-1]|uniref:tyrosinase n=1 Tax=Pestalotiopsis fici (strain W106-1 / CGMCC3.15140) TaxID=1229662 RepID=W3XNJ3_PESFW|nr:uncharacterized protein PFICI_01382 [Pestalotiopsis fici W106-1]ETS87554.1 hypothetical protein PFICI_01382 [Pestalotiopsis fici W106-1]
MLVLWRHLFLLLGLFSCPLLAANEPRGYDYGPTAQETIGKRDISQNDSQNALVQPIAYNGSIPLRPELRELQDYHEQWNLYILALSWMQWLNQSDPASWYAIAGIHGAPFADYGGVKALPGNKANGYCTHVSILFPPWHRAYLALFEQTLFTIVQTIAAWYPDEQRETFQRAADTFRIPYWDWAMKPSNGSSVFPSILWGSSKIEVDGPNGKQNISNPLFSYVFNPLNPGIFEEYPFMYWNETKRRPNPLQSPNATSDNEWVSQAFSKNLPTIQQRLYALFATSGNYSEWSNEAWIPDSSNSSFDSIESLHDTVHLTCGGNFGHMAIIAYSSFDPCFFLHHANIDRLFAMWQVVYNESWLEPTQAILPTRTIRTGDNQTSLSDLTPFYRNETQFWNSDDVRDHKVFGYSYADVVSGNRSDVIAAINRLYTDFTPATLSPTKHNVHGAQANFGRRFQERSSEDLVTTDGVYREWIANIHVNKFALGASFTVHLFLGHAPKYFGKFEMSNGTIGTLGIFAGGHHTHAGLGPLQVGGTIPLTSVLAELVISGNLPSMHPVDVGPFLKQSLGFLVLHQNGSYMDPNAINGLHISIVSSQVTAPETKTELADWGKVDTRLDLY